MIVPIRAARTCKRNFSLEFVIAGLSAAATGFVWIGNYGCRRRADGASGFSLFCEPSKARTVVQQCVSAAFGQEQTAVAGKSRGPTGAQRDPRKQPPAILAAANKVFDRAGYGMAVAQAQPQVARALRALTKRGVDVKFGLICRRAYMQRT